MSTQPQPPVATEDWKPYPNDPQVPLYGHEKLILIYWGSGSLRILDNDGDVIPLKGIDKNNVLVDTLELAGKGTNRQVVAMFNSPEPDPGQPHFAKIELTVDAFGEDGRILPGTSFQGPLQLDHARERLTDGQFKAFSL